MYYPEKHLSEDAFELLREAAKGTACHDSSQTGSADPNLLSEESCSQFLNTSRQASFLGTKSRSGSPHFNLLHTYQLNFRGPPCVQYMQTICISDSSMFKLKKC